jgi:PPOX class probable F420-dependent enzyme
MAKMSEEKREEYLAGLHVGVIAVERADRAPFAVPIWYGYRPGGEVVLWTTAGTLKERLIREAGRFSITAQDENPPYRYVTAEGDVTTIEPAEDAEARAIAVRYLGENDGNAFADENLSADSIFIRMKPRRWLSEEY